MERRNFIGTLLGGAALATVAPDRLLAATQPVAAPPVPVAPPPALPADFWTVLRDAYRSGDAIWVTDGRTDKPCRAHVTAYSQTWGDFGTHADATIRTVDPDPLGFAREWSVSGSLPKDTP